VKPLWLISLLFLAGCAQPVIVKTRPVGPPPLPPLPPRPALALPPAEVPVPSVQSSPVITWSNSPSATYTVYSSSNLVDWAVETNTTAGSYIVTQQGAGYYRVMKHSLASATLAWNEVPDPYVSAYRFYQGDASRVYTSVATIGATSVRVTGLVPGRTYFFAVTAVGLAGLESQYSNEAVYTPPIETFSISIFP
jgi:hypothetical protein